MEQQINIVNWRIIHQPLQFTAFVYIPCNLSFYQCAVNGDHASIGVFDLNAANNHISMVYRRKDGNIGWVEPKADN